MPSRPDQWQIEANNPLQLMACPSRLLRGKRSRRAGANAERQRSRKKANMKITFFGLLAILASVVAVPAAPAPTNRPAIWAQPVVLEGVPSLYKVSDTLYRSAQPTAAGMQHIKKMGIKTVVNLRSFHSDQDELENTGLSNEQIYMKPWHPEEEDVIHFLRIVTNPTNAPVLVHCQRGAERTGTMCAIYRIVVQGWSKKEAIREMTKGEFGFHEVWQNLPDWIQNLDIEKIRRAAGIEP